MKVLIFGDGLLGKELADKTGWDVVSRKTTGLDITDYDSIDNNADFKASQSGLLPIKLGNIIALTSSSTAAITSSKIAT